LDKFDKYLPVIKKYEPGYKFSWQISTEIIENQLEHKPYWLDIGARNNNRLRVHPQAKFAIGLDPEAEGDVYTDSNNTFCRGSVYELPFKGDTFDFITSRFVFEHLEHPKAAFEQIAASLKPGGLVMIETTNKNNPLIVAARLIPFAIKKVIIKHVFKDNPSGTYKTFYSLNTPKAIRQYDFQAAGLKLEKLHVVNDIICESKILFTFSLGLYKFLKLFGFENLFGNLIIVLRKA